MKCNIVRILLHAVYYLNSHRLFSVRYDVRLGSDGGSRCVGGGSDDAGSRAQGGQLQAVQGQGARADPRHLVLSLEATQGTLLTIHCRDDPMVRCVKISLCLYLLCYM